MKSFETFMLLLFVGAFQGCGTTGTGSIFFEQSVKRNDVEIARVAIVPNRLPLNLQDPEKWRLINWEIARREFEERGYEVVDYRTSVNAFVRSGLPIEDTKSSRDKYADLANALNVDAIIIPYYGTFAAMKNVFLFVNTGSYVGVATFQIYLRKQNDFFTRVDCSGENYYTTGFFMPIGIGLTFVQPAVGLVVEGVGLVYDLVVSLRSSDSRWEAAFAEAIHEGLAPFFGAVGNSGGNLGETNSGSLRQQIAPGVRKDANDQTAPKDKSKTRLDEQSKAAARENSEFMGKARQTATKNTEAGSRNMEGAKVSQNFSAGASFAVSFPTGDQSSFLGTSFGGAVQFDFNISSKLSFGLTSGYLHFPYKDMGGLSITKIPVHLQSSYSFRDRTLGAAFYVGASAGLTQESFEYGSFANRRTMFGFVPRAGIQFPLNLGTHCDISAQYCFAWYRGYSSNNVTLSAGVLFEF
jgi:hypothetical protein